MPAAGAEFANSLTNSKFAAASATACEGLWRNRRAPALEFYTPY